MVDKSNISALQRPFHSQPRQKSSHFRKSTLFTFQNFLIIEKNIKTEQNFLFFKYNLNTVILSANLLNLPIWQFFNVRTVIQSLFLTQQSQTISIISRGGQPKIQDESRGSKIGYQPFSPKKNFYFFRLSILFIIAVFL